MQEHDQNLGMEFVWWMGVVEDRQDPQKAGRYRVRIIGAHTENKSDLPSEQLPWAQTLVSVNVALKEGDFVMGFYVDGHDAQVPVIMGSLHGVPAELRPASKGFSDPRTAAQLKAAPKPPKSLRVSSGPVSITEGTGQRNPHPLNESTVSRMARNEKTSLTPIQFKKNTITSGVPTAGGGSWSEPTTPYAAQYPYNHVIETEAGHLIELDDTPGAERLHIYHRSGTFDEVHPDGTKVSRVHATHYEIVLGDKNIVVHGDVNITASGAINLKAGGDLVLEAAGDVNISALGQIKTQGTTQSHVASGPMDLSGIPMNLNGPGVVSGTPPTPVTVVTAGSITLE